MKSVARSETDGRTITSEVLPFTFRLVAGPDRPRIEVVSTETGKKWLA